MRKLYLLCIAALFLVSNTSFGQCFTASSGQYPAATYTPSCTGSVEVITTLGYAGEYSMVNVTSGNSYVFSSTVATDFITISDAGGTIAYAFGTTPVSWTASFTGVVRFYTHTNAACGEAAVSRNRQLTCTLPPCTVPANQPTGLVLTPISTGQINGSFTAAGGAPTGYLTVRYPAGSAVTSPVNATTYSTGNTLGLGKVVQASAATTFSATGLTPSTNYDFYVYSYNNPGGCSGPTYKVSGPAPLSGSSLTLACAPLAAGTYSVGPTGTYASLTAVAAALSNGTAGPVIFELQSTYLSSVETFPITFSASACPVTNVTIRPEAAVASTLNIVGTNTTAIIDINGGTNITFDGRPGGVGTNRFLTISNLSTATGGSAFRFINDASSNTIKYCVVKSLFASTTSGVIVFSTTTGTTGNDNNTIDNCDIDGGAGATLSPTLNATNGIYSAGSTTTTVTLNSGNTVSNCNVFNYFNAAQTSIGINLQTGNDNWTISNNKIYQTSPRAFTGTVLRYSGITLNYTGGFYTVTGNTIGFASSAGAGVTNISGSTNTVRGIDGAGVTAATPTVIQNNTISGLIQGSASTGTGTSGPFIAIGAITGRFNVLGNTIGSQDGSSTITITMTGAGTGLVVGVYDFSVNSNTISNNNMGAIAIGGTATTIGFRAILANTTGSAIETIQNNIIGGTVPAGAITNTLVGSYAMYAINTALPAVNMTGNLVRNMVGNSNGAVVVMTGYTVTAGTATNPSIISGNTVHSISDVVTGGAAGAIYAFDLTMPALANVIERNSVHSVNVISTLATYQIFGLVMRGSGNATFRNNMVRLGLDATGASITTGFSFVGIRDIALATSNYYHNSVYIGGTGVVSVSNTYCFLSDVVTNTRKFQNNIFYNARSNASGGIANIAIRVGGTAPNPAGLFSDNNDLLANGTDGVIGVFNGLIVPTMANWRTATAMDGNSISANPNYVTPNGTAVTGDLHIANPTPIESAGYDVGVVDDYDGQTRSTLTPVDMGADAGNFTVLDVAPPVIYYTPFIFTCSTGDRLLSPVTITDATGVPTTGTLRPRVYYKKNAGGYFSQPGTLLSGTGTNGQWSFNIVASDMGGLAVGDVVTYYFIAQDIVAVPNLGSYASGVVATDVNTVTTPPTAPSSYSIAGTSLSGTYTVGTAGAYPTLTAAVAAYNTACLLGPVVFNLTDATYPSETFPISINANAYASAVNTLTIKPTVNAAITGSSATSLILFNGADWVTINGSTSATANTVCPASAASRNLTISNTNAGTTSAIIWLGNTAALDGVNNCSVQNCILIGNAPTTTLIALGAGGPSIGTGNTAGANNNNNSFINNDIRASQFGIYSSGPSAASKNQNLTINQNFINTASPNNVGITGIYSAFTNNITVSGNTVGGMSNAASSDVVAINLGMGALSAIATTTTGIADGVSNVAITNNTVTGATQTGTFAAAGIALGNTISGTALIANNMVYGVNSNGTSTDFGGGIVLGGGTAQVNVYNNTVSMQGTISGATGASSASVALAVTSGVASPLDIRNNILSNTQLGNPGASLRLAAIALGYASPYTGLLSNNNDLYSAGAGPGTYTVGVTGGVVGTNRTTLAAWQTETGQDAASKNVLPVFVSLTDLHLVATAGTNWCLNGSGQNIPAITNDIDCQVRNNPPDIGADEFVATGSGAPTPASQTICSGSAITTITLTGGTTYTWTRDNVATVTGMAANGSGNISGSLTNTTAAPITVTFTITPADAVGCVGPSYTATVLVNPTPNAVATPASQTVCSGTAITTIVLTSATAGTTYAWTRDNVATVTGIAASGSGNISGTLTNTTTSPVTVTFTITPTANTCPGAAITATVIVNPSPDVAQPANQSVCNNTATAPVIFTGAVAGTTFTWTNNTPSIGLAASGSGNIPSFTATNATAAPVTATITVTPVTGFTSSTFNYTGAMQTFTVPAGVTSVTIGAYGAQGGSGAAGGSGATGGNGGLGASATGTLTVTPGQVLNIFVGGAGATPAGGFNGGGNGGSTNAGGGGGASDVRVSGIAPANRVITAGGGGGGGRGGCIEVGAGLTPGNGGVGGIGGGGVGTSGGNSAQAGFGPAGGGFPGNSGAIQGAFGAKGIGCAGFSGTDGAATATEVGGGGGTGQACCCPAGNSVVGGGGGGGGQLGGGGGGGGSAGTTGCQGNSKGAGGGGGGGSTYVGGVTSTSTASGVQTGDGMVVITYAVPPTCSGTPKTFTITVKPTPVAVATPASQAVCSGTPITTIANTSTTSGTTFAWTRDNNVNVTGIAASGSGDISGTLTSSTGVVEVVTFTITPTANGCPGAPITATVTVNPLPSWTTTIVEPTTCVTADGSITLNMSGPGPYTFAWTGVGVVPGAQNQSNLTVGIYNVTVTENATGCQTTASYTLLGPGGCFVCPSIPNMTANPSPACTGSTVTVQTTGMTNMGITYGITFKYSAGVPLGNPYVGGTTIATIPNAGLTAGGTTATTTTSFATAGTYYIYAILSPTPVDPSCRPSNVVVLTVNSTPTLTLGTSPTVCSGSITASLPFTSTYTGPNGNILVNGGFETGGTAPWVVGSAVPAPTISGTVSHTGTYSWALGKYGAAGDAAGDASGYQTVTIPAEGGTLSYWYKPTSADAISDDWQDAYITNTSGAILQTVMHVANNSNAWTQVSTSLNAYAGQTVRVMFLVHNDGDGAVTNMYLDDVVINGPGGSPATYSITWSAPAPAQGFVNVVNGPLPSNPTPITLAVPAGAAPGTYTGTITVTNGGGCSTTPQTFTVTINPIPVVNQPGNQVVCNNTATAAVNFTTPTTGPGTIVYTWSHTASGIGLANNGTGNIPSFTAINNTNAPVVATITVIPSYTYNGVTCTGAPKSFTITINPTPTVNSVTNQTVCHNTATAAVNFSGFVPGTVYNWTNNTTSIGLAASGTGNIASFTATNATASPVIATITVTPSYTNAGVTCTGTPTTFTITVNPIPTVNAVANQTVCNGSNTTAVTFSGATTGTVYTWTNNNTTIGLAAAGTGNIGAFTAVNTGPLPVTATITVMPSYTNNGTTCTGTPTSFTITVNPSPTVSPLPANQLLCNGSATTAVNFNGPVSGAFYTWTNNQPSIGLASVGSSNIPSFIATNTGTAPVVATVTVTGNYTNNGVTCTGPSVTFTYTVNPTPSVNTIADQTVCNNTATAAVTIAGPVPGTVYNWTNNNTSIGLAASGIGNIGSFNAINNTAAPVTATITVTPTFTANGLSCSGTPVTFNITVNPRPTVNGVANQVLCAGSSTAAVTFTGNVLATTFSWTNSNTAIGLAASGTGNIPSFVATNTTNAPISGTITVTTNANACGGGSTSFTITVNPTATVNAVTNITACHGATVAGVTFGSNVAGSVFNWTNSNPTIGLGASGIGNLPSFTAVNPTTSPVTATISVTATMSANGVFCTGPVRTFTITINPGANIILTNAPIRVCLTDTVVLLTATPVGGVWSGVGVSGNTFNAAIAGLGVKTITYTVNNSFGCSGTKFLDVTVMDCLERHNVLKGALRIYPNPTTGQFNIRFLTDVYKEFSMNVLDAKGAVLKNYKFTGLVYGSIIPIDLRSLPSGYYTLEAYNTQERAAYQLIIAH